MASQKFEKGSAEFSWFGEFWQMVQKYWIPEVNDNYWKQVTDEIEDFYKKHENTDKLGRFTKKMSIAYLEFLDEEFRTNGR